MTRSDDLIRRIDEARAWARSYKVMYDELSDEHNALLDSFKALCTEDGHLYLEKLGLNEAVNQLEDEINFYMRENQELRDIIDAARCVLNGDEIPFDFLGGYMRSDSASDDNTVEEDYPWEYDSGW